MWDELKRMQPTVARVLEQALARERVAHAWLFTGPIGSGKRQAARLLAAALNCREAPRRGCGSCPVCRGCQEGRQFDLTWVAPVSRARQITIEQVQRVIRELGLPPSGGPKRVVVVEDADRMGREACNAFLKTLEEPPSYAVIVLLTAMEQQLLDTVISRCLRLRFAPVPVAGREPPPAVAAVLARLAAGGRDLGLAALGAAEELDGALAGIRSELDARVAEELAALTEQLPEDLSEAEWRRIEEERRALADGEYRRARGELIDALFFWYRDVYLTGLGMDRDYLRYAGAAERVEAAARSLTPEQALCSMRLCEQLREGLETNVQEQLALEVAFLDLARRGVGRMGGR